jgi:hypothetical protein
MTTGVSLAGEVRLGADPSACAVPYDAVRRLDTASGAKSGHNAPVYGTLHCRNLFQLVRIDPRPRSSEG